MTDLPTGTSDPPSFSTCDKSVKGDISRNGRHFGQLVERMVKFALLAASGVQAGSLYGAYDVLSAAGAVWSMVDGVPQQPRFEVEIAGRTTQALVGSGGVAVRPTASFDDIGPVEAVYVPAISFDPSVPLETAYGQELAFISRQHAAGAMIASACSGSLLVAAAGLLDDQEATTHWAFAPLMRRLFPAVRLREDQVFIASGRGGRILSAGGGTGWHDVILYLIARYGSLELARQQARMFLLQWHPDGQSPFAACLAVDMDAAVQSAQAWLAENVDAESPVARAASVARLPQRTFARRFRQATGMSPLAFVQRLRVEHAKELIEKGATDMEAVGDAVGYRDQVSFRRIFRRLVGMTPAEYRRRFALPPSVRAAAVHM